MGMNAPSTDRSRSTKSSELIWFSGFFWIEHIYSTGYEPGLRDGTLRPLDYPQAGFAGGRSEGP